MANRTQKFTVLKVYFYLEKETKNTYRYTEMQPDGSPVEDSDARIPNLYIRKKTFKGKDVPNRLLIHIAVPDEGGESLVDQLGL